MIKPIIMKKYFLLFCVLGITIFLTTAFKPNKVSPIKAPSPVQVQTEKDTISGKIVQVIPMGNKTVIVLDKGSKQGVKKDNTGCISDAGKTKFTITEVFSFRSKAIIEKAYTGSAKNVDIFVELNVY